MAGNISRRFSQIIAEIHSYNPLWTSARSAREKENSIIGHKLSRY